MTNRAIEKKLCNNIFIDTDMTRYDLFLFAELLWLLQG